MEENRKELIDQFIQEWSSRGNEKSIDSQFSLEGVPVWWFCKRYFVQHVMPKQINTFKEIYSQEPLSFARRVQLRVGSFFLRNAMWLNEKRKVAFFKAKKTFSEDKKVLFVSYSNHITKKGSIFRIQQIVDKVKGDKVLTPFVVFADPLSRKSFKKLKGEETIYQYITPEIKKKSRKVANELSQSWKKISLKTKSEQLTSGNDKIWPYLQFAFDTFFSKKFLYLLVLYYEAYKAMLELENIDTIVMTSQNSLFEKAVLAAAKEKNKTCVLLQHGFAEGKVNPDLIGNFKIAVFSQLYKEKFEKMGLGEQTTIVGPVIFDKIIQFKREKVKKEEKTILFTTTPAVEDCLISKEEYAKSIKKILLDISKIPKTKVIIKPHPAERYIDQYEEIIKENNLQNITILNVLDREEFYKIMASSDVLLHFNSTAALEAMILGIPNVDVKVFGEKVPHFLEKETFSTIISLNSRVDLAILKVLSHQNRKDEQEYINHMCGNVDGKSFQRVAELIYSISKVKPKN